MIPEGFTFSRLPNKPTYIQLLHNKFTKIKFMKIPIYIYLDLSQEDSWFNHPEEITLHWLLSARILTYHRDLVKRCVKFIR